MAENNMFTTNKILQNTTFGGFLMKNLHCIYIRDIAILYFWSIIALTFHYLLHIQLKNKETKLM